MEISTSIINFFSFVFVKNKEIRILREIVKRYVLRVKYTPYPYSITLNKLYYQGTS